MTDKALEAAITAWFGGSGPQPIEERFLPRMKAAVEAYHRELDTHVLVPVEPTEKMLGALHSGVDNFNTSDWQAMLSAAAELNFRK